MTRLHPTAGLAFAITAAACVSACAAESSESGHALPAPAADLPTDAVWVSVEDGAKRLSNQAHIFTTVPEQLAGLPAIAPHRGPSTSQPGPGYTVTLQEASAVYLAVHHRGQPTVPEAWQPTGLTLGWGNHEDDIYVQIVEAGPVTIPTHDGKAGGFGVPHMLIISPDTDTAQKLIDQPVKRESAIFRPARVIVTLPDPQQPGLYAHPGQSVTFGLRVIPGSDGKFPTALRIDARREEDTFQWTQEVQLDERGLSETVTVTPPAIGFYDIDITPVSADGSDYRLAEFRGGIGVVPEPNDISAASPWGAMRVANATFEAPLARALGADWVRHSNWNFVTPKPDGGVDLGRFGTLAKAYKDQGLHVMVSISLVPPQLSSKPGDTSQSGDAGPLESRVAPRDWNQWRRFMQDTTEAAGGLVDLWEIGNEPNTAHHYWAGTVDEFALLLKHSALGIRAADPDATILTAGFTLDPTAAPFLDRMMELGAGDYFDILSVHSLYAKALSPDDMRAVLQKHGRDPANTPVWSTEPKHVLPIRNFEAGIEKNFHFLLVNPGAYGAFQNLSERDGAATPWGVAYALAAKHIANARYVKTIATGLPDVELGLFAREGEQLLAATADEGPRGAGIRVRLTSPQGAHPRYTDLSGHERDVPASGEFVFPLDRSGVLYGAATIEVLGVEVDESATIPGIEVTADRATLEHGFVMRSDESREQYAVVYKNPEGVTDRPAVTFPFTLAEGDTYEFYVSAMWYPSHAGVLVSPFAWSVDGKSPTRARDDATVHWRRSTRSHLRFGEVGPDAGAGVTSSQSLARLGVVRKLAPGEHTLRLELQAPRTHDQHYSMEVELIALRPITDDRE